MLFTVEATGGQFALAGIHELASLYQVKWQFYMNHCRRKAPEEDRIREHARIFDVRWSARARVQPATAAVCDKDVDRTSNKGGVVRKSRRNAVQPDLGRLTREER